MATRRTSTPSLPSPKEGISPFSVASRQRKGWTQQLRLPSELDSHFASPPRSILPTGAISRSAIAPLLRSSNRAEYVGEIDETEKESFLGGALAVLFPIDWPEPFGLVMIEAMACGTPVIAFNRGSVSEVIEHGVTGFIVESVDEAVEAAKQAATLDRTRIRATFERRFTAETMAMGYEAAYQTLLEMNQGIPLPIAPTAVAGKNAMSAAKVINIMAALKESVQPKGRSKVSEAVRKRMGK